MARPEEAKAVKAFKDAKTPKEMVYSWASQSPGMSMDKLWEGIKPFAEKYPSLVEYYAHRGLQNIMDRGVLDRKTRELVLLRMFMSIPGGSICVAEQIANAKSAGATDDEIMGVVECACYTAGKGLAVDLFQMLNNGYEYAKDVTLYEP